ncbi:hypothetical protein QHL1GM_10850 [Halomonas sp. QHL1]|nr:hypothetical protein QHL1GM_10850 [Halomonas sp. QHL1]
MFVFSCKYFVFLCIFECFLLLGVLLAQASSFDAHSFELDMCETIIMLLIDDEDALDVRM